ncbi:MAG TPA: hypothetical protein VFQ68_14860 [Streptosporangiaceae bacterium]|nr:hypothetical protein [Streptosporangiaceae bacterium]
MIRRGFWLTAGAVTGIYGYRRVAAAGRRLSATLTPGRLAPEGTRERTRESTLESRLEGTLELARAGARARTVGRRARRGAIAAARETYRFTRDVREGMELYRRAHPAPAGSTLSTSQTRSANRTDHEPEDGH